MLGYKSRWYTIKAINTVTRPNAQQKKKSVQPANISETYSVINTKNFDTSTGTQKHLLWKRLKTDINNRLGYTNDVKIPTRNDSKLTLTIELKSLLVKKMSLRVWGYTNGEYLYMLIDGHLTLKYTT